MRFCPIFDEVIAWGVGEAQTLQEALLRSFGELWQSMARSIQKAAAPILPVLSSNQRDALVTVALVVGGAVAVFLLIEMWLFLVRRVASRRSI